MLFHIVSFTSFTFICEVNSVNEKSDFVAKPSERFHMESYILGNRKHEVSFKVWREYMNY